jgi:predicted ATPase
VGCWREVAGVGARHTAPAVALNHLQAGLDMLALVPEGEQRRRFEADLLFSSAAMAVTVDGWNSARGERALRRARELYLELGDTAAANRATYALAGLHEYRGEFDRSQALMAQRLQTAAGDERALVELHDILACSAFHLGEFRDALHHAEEAVSRYDAVRDRAALAVVGENPFVTSQHWAAYSLWFTGRVDTAVKRSDAAVRMARRPDHAFSLCLALEAAAVLRQFRREPDRVLALAEEMRTLAVEGGLAYRQATAGVLLGWARGCLGEPAEGCHQLDAALDAYRRTGAAMDLPYFLVLHAEVARLAGQHQTAQRALDEARTLARARPSFIEPEIERLTGMVLLQTGADPRIVETHLRSALATASEQDALSLQLRAAADLRRLQLTQGRPADAAPLLRSIMDRFTEGLDTVDLQEAAALLAS